MTPRMFGDFQPIDPFDWMTKMSKTLETTIRLQQRFEQDLKQLNTKLEQLQLDLHDLQLSVDLVRMKQETLEND